jgi:hypothetical protein
MKSEETTIDNSSLEDEEKDNLIRKETTKIGKNNIKVKNCEINSKLVK